MGWCGTQCGRKCQLGKDYSGTIIAYMAFCCSILQAGVLLVELGLPHLFSSQSHDEYSKLAYSTALKWSIRLVGIGHMQAPLLNSVERW